MPTLNWIGKDAVVKHHQDVPFRLLEPDEKLSHGDADDGNLIVQGDNLHALKALLPKYAGKVKCIYIDPPYNTGNEGWVYNDNVKAPEIKKWLGQVVGKEAEDLSRHDKWLCMMYPRMVLLKQFLSEDGAIFVSIDDNEVANLRLLMDEIFGRGNFVAQLVWKARQHLDSRAISRISTDHEYLFLYKKSRDGGFAFRGRERDLSKYTNPDADSRGLWMSRSILGLADAKARPNLHYLLTDPVTNFDYPCPPNTGWRYSRERMDKLIAEGCILFPKKRTGRPREKVFLKNLIQPYTCYPSIIQNVYTDHGTASVRAIFGEGIFAFPKPPELIANLIEQATDKDSIILDSFAGSGTTGHAVLKQNAADGGNRKFILVEMEENIAQNITAERVRRVSTGYKDSKGKDIEGLGGSFQFCRLSKEPLFAADGRIREDITFDQLAEFVWFSETGSAWPGWKETGKKKTKKHTSPLGPIFDQEHQIRNYPRGPMIGIKDGHAFILLYNGILADRSDLGGNVLNQRTLDYLQKNIDHEGPMTIFAARCRFGKARLRAQNITYKQLPYRLSESLCS